MDFYASISRWYDDIFPYSAEQKRFVERRSGEPKGKRLLDVGCGTGALSIELSRSGYEVQGIDYDGEMVDRALEKKRSSGLHGYPLFQQMDMRQIDRHFDPAFFDVILCLGNTLVHLQDQTAIAGFFSASAHIMNDGADLIVQILNYDYIIDSAVTALPRLENEFIIFERSYSQRGDGLLDFNTTLTVKSDALSVSNSIPLFPLRKDPLLAMIERAGYTISGTFGSFEGGNLLENSLPLIVHAKKSKTNS